LVVADEPTSALDAVTQREILRLFEELRASGSSVLLITHNPSILRGLAQETVRVGHGRVGPREPLETAGGPAKCR
jgi:ABC-type glutathione transport system ATPase component